MNYAVVPLNWIVSNATITWMDMVWAYENKILGVQMLRSFAEHSLKEEYSDLIDRIVKMPMEFSENVGSIAKEIANNEGNSDYELIKRKWMYILLKYFYEKRNDLRDPLSYVEQIYADFDYPEEIESFVRYMPPKTADADSHFVVRGEGRLYLFWSDYIRSYDEVFK